MTRFVAEACADSTTLGEGYLLPKCYTLYYRNFGTLTSVSRRWGKNGGQLAGMPCCRRLAMREACGALAVHLLIFPKAFCFVFGLQK